MNAHSQPLGSLLRKRVIFAFIISLIVSLSVTGLISFGLIFYLLGDAASFEAVVNYQVSIFIIPLFLIVFVMLFFLISNALIRPFIREHLVRPLRSLSSEINIMRFDDVSKMVPKNYKVYEVEKIYHALETHIQDFHSMYDKFDALMLTEHKTGLLRRAHLHESLRHEVFLAQRFKRIFSIVIVKIKQLKDPSHTADETVQSFTQQLKSSTRNIDMLFYISDRLFILVAPQTGCEEVNILASELANRIQKSHRNEQDFSCQFEIGCATYGEAQGITPNELLHSAMRDLHQIMPSVQKNLS
ncbi:GGDEF domain-containing protein [Thiomicrospira pelophila]|uniref:GGDEF domain-containing protein n=1 Tax=Thiomicrospira pelophila TaxID=934 RepID=UPI0004A75906|nr:diguanylate cyclase [Thiomicrospira pelophila]